MHYRVALDTETGGINPAEHSLLEVALVVTDDRGTQLAEYSSTVLPKDGLYRVAPKALEINQIDLRTHAAGAMPAERVAQEVGAFLADFRTSGPLILVGWNVNFDRGFLQHQLLGFEGVAQLFGYRTMDLHAVMAFQADAGRMPYTKSLEETARFFGLVSDGEKQEHRALADTRLTAQVYREMLKFAR